MGAATRSASNYSAVRCSPWGLGACEAVWEVDAVREIGRHSERWRYGRAERLPPRRRVRATELAAEGAAGSYACLEARVGAELSSAVSSQQLGPPRERDLSSFPEVPRHVLEKSEWRVTGRRRWDRLEGMPVLEARAVLYHVRHALRAARNHGKRLLVLGDSLSSVSATARMRAHSHAMLSIMRNRQPARLRR